MSVEFQRRVDNNIPGSELLQLDSELETRGVPAGIHVDPRKLTPCFVTSHRGRKRTIHCGMNQVDVSKIVLFGDGSEEIPEATEEQMASFPTLADDQEYVESLKREAKGKAYACGYCGARYASQASVKRHQWSDRERKTTCPENKRRIKLPLKIDGPFSLE